MEQKAHSPTETCPSKQSDSASIFVNTQLFTFQFPLLWDIFLCFQPGSGAKYYRVSLLSTCQQIQTSTKSYKYKTRSIRLSHGVINSLFTVRSCRNHDLLLQNQSSNMKVSTPLLLQILTIPLSTNVHSKSISIPSKSCLYKLGSKKQLSKIKLVLPLKLKSSTSRCDLQSTNCTASAACWERWLCLSLHNDIPKGWIKRASRASFQSFYHCRSHSWAFICSQSKAKCLNTTESSNHLPSSTERSPSSSASCVLILGSCGKFLPSCLEPLLFCVVVLHPKNSTRLLCVTQKGRMHLGWSTTVTSLLFPHFWSQTKTD